MPKLFSARWQKGPDSFLAFFYVEETAAGIRLTNFRTETIRQDETDRFIDVLLHKVIEDKLPPEQAIQQAEEAVPAKPSTDVPLFPRTAHTANFKDDNRIGRAIHDLVNVRNVVVNRLDKAGKLKCAFCGSEISGWEYFKIKDASWNRAALPRHKDEFLCLSCVEKAFGKCGLGNKVTVAHLEPAYPWWGDDGNLKVRRAHQSHFDGLVDAIAGEPSKRLPDMYDSGYQLGQRIGNASTQAEKNEFLRLAWPHTRSKGNPK